MKLSELFKSNGDKWEGLELENRTLGVFSFTPKFSTSDGVVIGLNSKGEGAEFHLDTQDGWRFKSKELTYIDFYKVIEVFRKQDKKYFSTSAKEWYPTIEQAKVPFSSDKLVITRILLERKPVEIPDDFTPVLLENRGYGQAESSKEDVIMIDSDDFM